MLTNDGSVAVCRRIRTIRKGYAVGDILDEARISVTWRREGQNGQRRPFFHVLRITRGNRTGVNATLVFRVPRLRATSASKRGMGRWLEGKLEEARVPWRERRRAVINLGRYSCTNENRGRDRGEF